MYYIYKSCIGDPIITDFKLSEDDLVCDVCGKSAIFISSADNEIDIADIINNNDFKFSHIAKEEIENMFWGLKYDPKSGIILE